MTVVDAADLVAAVRPQRGRALIATDFDGTLAPLERHPEDSRLAAGALDALTTLAELGAQIAVITGRDARTVLRLGGLASVPGLTVAGIYGVETWTDGALRTPDTPPAMTALQRRLPAALHGADPAIWIEDKRLSLVVHARQAADPAAALATISDRVRALGAELGLEVHPGSDVLELRLPGYDKAQALARLAEGHGLVLFFGDDTGDLPAFEQIHVLRARGVPAWGVGVLASGADGIADAADVTLPDPSAVVDLLRALAN